MRNVDLLLQDDICAELRYGHYCNLSAELTIKPKDVPKLVTPTFGMCFPSYCDEQEILEKAQYILDIVRNQTFIRKVQCDSPNYSREEWIKYDFFVDDTDIQSGPEYDVPEYPAELISGATPSPMPLVVI